MALALAALYSVVWFYGGPAYALSKFGLAGQSTIVYYVIGLVTIMTYIPLHSWRKWQDRKLAAAAGNEVSATGQQLGQLAIAMDQIPSDSG